MEGNQERVQEVVQRPWNYNVSFEYDLELCKKISKGCGSQVMKRATDYIRFIRYHAHDKFWGFTVDDTAYLFGTFAKTHFLLAEIAVESKNQRKGYGSLMMAWLFEECAKRGVHQVKLRTSKQETAHLWYKKLGAEYTGTKGDDYEMRFVI